jgi:mono/diheme cytochrome c family protein
MDRIPPALVMTALEDSSRDVRTSALRLSERWLADSDASMEKAVLAHLTDPDWAVRRQLAATIGSMKGDARDPAVISLLEQNGDDPIVADAALSGIAGSEAAVLDRIAASRGESPQRRSAIAALAATILRGRQDASSQRIFDLIADPARPEWQRASMLTGAEAAVLDTALPGSTRPARGAGADAAACPTCPGARTGPGGASAFPSSTGRGAASRAPAAAPAGRGRGAPAIGLNLTREPALVRVAAEGGDLGRRAAAVLERVGWPGKPGMATAAAPLTPAEQQRFDAGQEIYKTVCEACHQPDGRGREKLAPSLVGSELALGPDGIPARILINGKEGSVGLMPPLGAGMTDEQVAAVLTYVRRAWGQPASPVTPASVSGVRSQVAGRTRPWTNEELQKIIGAGGQ